MPEDFLKNLALERRERRTRSLGKLLRELREPRPAGRDCITWLGETAMKDRVLQLCAGGKIAIDVRGMEYLQAQPGEDQESAWSRLRSKLPFTGRAVGRSAPAGTLRSFPPPEGLASQCTPPGGALQVVVANRRTAGSPRRPLVAHACGGGL